MNLNSILSSLGSLSSQVASAITGAGPLVQAGQALIQAFHDIKGANNGEAPADAEAAHQALVAKVNQHADATFNRAEGGGEG